MVCAPATSLQPYRPRWPASKGWPVSHPCSPSMLMTRPVCWVYDQVLMKLPPHGTELAACNSKFPGDAFLIASQGLHPSTKPDKFFSLMAFIVLKAAKQGSRWHCSAGCSRQQHMQLAHLIESLKFKLALAWAHQKLACSWQVA